MLLISSAVGSIVWNFIISYFARPTALQADRAGRNNHSILPQRAHHECNHCLWFPGLSACPQMHSHFWKWTIIIVSALIILFIGFSRVFQGGHYLTDVLGGYALGLAWAGLVFLIIENIYWRRKA